MARECCCAPGRQAVTLLAVVMEFSGCLRIRSRDFATLIAAAHVYGLVARVRIFGPDSSLRYRECPRFLHGCCSVMGRIALEGGAFAICLYACSVAAASRVKWSVAFAKCSLDALVRTHLRCSVVQFAATLALGEWMV